MSAKKYKRKAGSHRKHSRSLLSRYPGVCLVIGVSLMIVGILLLTVGYVTEARIGLSMLALFFGGGLTLFANSFRSKKLNS
ncbi:hypothetical protein E2R68_02500 [Psychromonas sp. RZ22]|uniref:hypothetical protein n=1 Tax=Psychromonas algarum TaxID=2555643 RepID=UPI001067AD52|nr:hypothetical protein [Psychromonas sp. RZ22]TEW55982.1 hypothetical protein E2R68_02500 [Psychromonas sp. RZ22]